MRFIRQIIADAMSGGVLAGLVAVMLLLQGAIGGYGQSAMAAASLVDPGVICSSHDGVDNSTGTPLGGRKLDCCLTACQIAASLVPALPAKSPAVFIASVQRMVRADRPENEVAAPRALGLTRDARGPPKIFA